MKNLLFKIKMFFIRKKIKKILYKEWILEGDEQEVKRIREKLVFFRR